MNYGLDIVTFSSYGGSPLYTSLMVGVKAHSLVSTPHELSQQIYMGLTCLFVLISLYLSATTPLEQVLDGFPYN